MEMLSRTVKAIEALSPRLSYVVLPTGTKVLALSRCTLLLILTPVVSGLWSAPFGQVSIQQ